ncbi:MAG: energy-coupling factor transporter transmembrane component T family protein, partial [Actinomycetota bacterium]
GRNVTLGQYIPRRSPLHELDPRTKIIGWIVLAIGMFFTGSYAGMILLGLVVLALIPLARLPSSYVLRGVLPMLPFLAVIYVFQLLFSGSLYPGAEDVLWRFWIFEINAEGLRASTLVIIRVIVLYLSVTVLTLVTSIVMLVDGAERLTKPLRRLGVPNQELAMVAAISVRFVPTLIQEAEKLMKAQMARGAELETGNVIKKTRARIPVFIPLFINTLRRAGELSTAMEARCYRGGEGRTKRRRLEMTAADWGALGFAVVITLVVVVVPDLMVVP